MNAVKKENKNKNNIWKMNNNEVILPWVIPIQTWIRQYCSSRVGLAHLHVLSTAKRVCI